MGVTYRLVNYTKKEQISFIHIGAFKARELAGNPASAAMTTWYLLQHLGDAISFVTYDFDDWPFPEGTQEDLNDYPNVEDQIVEQLIEQKILVDEGRGVYREDEPDIYTRVLRNIWMD